MTAGTTSGEQTSYLPKGMPLPALTPGIEAPYWEATQRHELVVQRCTQCQTWQFGPEVLCHNCHSFDMTWEKVSGRGVIFSWERVWHPIHPALKDFGPYLVVLVELPDAGNVRMIGNLLGDPRQEVVIGAPVVAEYEDHEEGPTLVQWRVQDS